MTVGMLDLQKESDINGCNIKIWCEKYEYFVEFLVLETWTLSIHSKNN